MQNKTVIPIAAGLVVLVILFAAREYIELLFIVLFGFAIDLLPSIGLLSVVGGIGFIAYKYFTKKSSQPLQTQQQTPAKTEFAAALAAAFRRNNMRDLQHALKWLPSWPITEQIQQTAKVLFELKQTISRAKSEGVPVTMINRYQQNVAQAAETVWQLASKVDAVAIQQVSYSSVASFLYNEGLQLEQLQQAVKESHEGIALLILSGSKREILQDVEQDLRALTQAINSLGASRPSQP